MAGAYDFADGVDAAHGIAAGTRYRLPFPTLEWIAVSDLPPPPPLPPSGSTPGPYPAGPPSGPPVRPPSGPPVRPPEGRGDETTPWIVPGGPPSGPLGDEEVTSQGGGGRRRTTLAVVAALGVVALLAATVAFVAGDGGEDDDAATAGTSAPDDPPGTAAPPSTELEADPIPEAEFLALIDELQEYVEQARGLEFTEDVAVELADDEQFEARLLEDFEEDAEDIEKAEVFYRALGLLDSERTLLEELRDIYSTGVLGFYDPEPNELVVRGRTPSPYVQQTIVHELVHALDDQHFELHRPAYDDRKDEIATGFSAVVEGNARRIEHDWMDEQPQEFQDQAEAEEAAFAAGIDPSAFPEILLFQIGAPYELGEVFVGGLLDGGGERAVDGALTEPPDTSEQFVFPGIYEQRQPRIEVPPPPADGDIVDDGVVGALFLIGLLSTGDSTVDQLDMGRAVDGWGGDWAVTWTDGELACVRADFVGDTEPDTDELESVLSQWAEDSASAQVDTVDGRVRLESCNPAAGGPPPQI